MSQQDKIGEYRQKLRELWNQFLTVCGDRWKAVKNDGQKASDFLRRQGKQLAQKLAACLLKARESLLKAAASLRRHGKQLAQKLAVYLLKAREALQKAAAFLGGHWERLAQKLAPYSEKAGEWMRKALEFIRSRCKQLAQMLALLILKGKELLSGGMGRIRDRFAVLRAKLPQRKPRETAELPAAEMPEEVEAPSKLPEPPEVKALPQTQTVQETEIPVGSEEEPAPTPQPRDLPVWLQKAKPYLLKAAAFFGAIGRVFKFIIKWIWKLRAFIMSIPVVWAAVKLAMENMERLPEMVGLDIQSTGEFAYMVSRSDAVYWPLGITLFCILLTLCSKKPLLPWVISIFTLVLPLLIWITNYYA